MITSDLNINDTFKKEFSFTQNEVNAFATLTGDTNPIHLDKNYAKNSIFKKRIMHGFLSASIFSRVFGTLFPSKGCIYLKQELNFLSAILVVIPNLCNEFTLSMFLFALFKRYSSFNNAFPELAPSDNPFT